MELRLDGPDWAAALRRNLAKGHLGEEAQGDYLAIRLIEAGHGGTDGCGVLGALGETGRVERPGRLDTGRTARSFTFGVNVTGRGG